MPNANDIFISYAWDDNEPPVGSQSPDVDRWVWLFETALKAALKRKLGAPPKVWIDRREVRADEKVQAVLVNALKDSRLLVVLMSPNWQSSKWCRTELETYLEHHPGTDTNESVFVVEIEPVERAQWHERIEVLGAFEFHKPLSKGEGRVRLGDPLPDPKQDRDFYNDILVLATQIATRLREGVVQAEPVVEARDRMVWIAEPTDDLLFRRRDLEDAIRQAGYGIVTPSLDAWRRSGDAYVEQQLERGLRSAGLYVHLLGPRTGEPFDARQSWVQKQSDVAQRVAAADGWPHIAWRDVGTMVAKAEANHQPLLLRAIEQNFEEFRRDVVARLPVIRTVVARPPDRGVSICVTLSEEDEKVGDEVRRMLDELDVTWMKFTDRVGAAPDTAGEDRALAGSNGVVIVYGAADPGWMVTKVQKTNRLRGRREQTWGALVDAPLPGKSPAPEVRAVERHDWSGGPDFERMRHFIRTIDAQSHV